MIRDGPVFFFFFFFFFNRKEKATFIMMTPMTEPSWNSVSLSRIDAIVAAHLGETRVPGNAHPAALKPPDRDVSGQTIGGWSYETIGRFYNGRDHSTVHYAVQRVEALRENSPDLDSLLCELKRAISEAGSDLLCGGNPRTCIETLEEL